MGGPQVPRLGAGSGRRGGASQRLDDIADPPGRGVLVVGFAVDAGDDAGRSQLGEALVEFASMTAEVVVVGVAEREHGVAGVGEMRCAVSG